MAVRMASVTALTVTTAQNAQWGHDGYRKLETKLEVIQRSGSCCRRGNPVIWSQLPDDVKAMIPASWMGVITAVVAVCGIVGRMVKQPAASDPK
jgi:hypothetical protein